MWLFTRYGFYSIACAKRPDGTLDPETMMIRARRRAHLAGLQTRFPQLAGKAIATSPTNDYQWRMIISKAEWVPVIVELAQEQTWDNFKNEASRYQGAAGRDYTRALHDVWSVMNDFQA
jgi:hypothetical protein